MPVMNMIQALNDAHEVMMARDRTSSCSARTSAISAASSASPRGCRRSSARPACFDAPITEGGIVATAVGMAAYGLRPVVEIQFADYIYPGYDQIVSEVAKMRYRTAGEWTMPMVIRTPYGGGIFGGQTHSQSPESLFTHVAGLKVVIPSNPYDAKGLLIAAIEDPDPVIFFEPKRIYNGPFDGHHDRPVTPWSKHPGERGARGPLHGAARQGRDRPRGRRPDRPRLWHDGPCRPGRGRGPGHRRRGHRPAHARAARHRDDRASVEKTGRCLIVQEAPRTSGFGGGTVRAGPGALLLPSRGAGRARDRLGHALSARLRMGVFPRPQAHEDARWRK